MTVFRGILRRMILEALGAGELSWPPSLSLSKTHSLLNRVGRCRWNVRIRARYVSGGSVAGYRARYVSGGPIFNNQLHTVTETEISAGIAITGTARGSSCI